MLSRCKQLCGQDRKDCFISNRRQIACIADMVINKIAGMSYILQMLKAEVTKEHKPLIEKIEREIQALVDWVRFLEVSADLKEAIRLYQDYPQERRRELRFPVTDILKQFVGLEVEVKGFLQSVELVNISNSGLLFRVSDDLSPGTTVKARLLFLKNPISRREFNIVIKHCEAHEKGFLVGAEVEKDQSDRFKLFESIYEYLKDALEGTD